MILDIVAGIGCLFIVAAFLALLLAVIRGAPAVIFMSLFMTFLFWSLVRIGAHFK